MLIVHGKFFTKIGYVFCVSEVQCVCVVCVCVCVCMCFVCVCVYVCVSGICSGKICVVFQFRENQ